MTARSACRLAALGMANVLGATPDEIWPRLVAGDTGRFVRRSGLAPGREILVGMVEAELPVLGPEMFEYDCRNNRLTALVLEQIRAPIRDAIGRFGRARVAVVTGTSTSGVGDAEDAIRHREKSGSLPWRFRAAQLEFGGISEFVAAYLGVTGPAFTLSTACSSGARALASARSLLELGVADAVVCGATDTICGLTSSGFSSLGLISEQLTNPCSANRCGITLGEAGVFFLVTRDEGGVQLVGVGESSEAHHMTAPDPDGAGALAAMRSALEDAGLRPSDLAYINLHGTGTPANDAMECVAIARLFGDRVPVSSTKPLTGHTLGAAGVTGAAFCMQMLEHRGGDLLALPPHRWDAAADPALPRLDFVGDGRTAHVGGTARLMSNSFGFGGNNCTLILAGAAAPGGTSSSRTGPAAAAARGIEVVIRDWAAWAPGIETPDAWRRWANLPVPLSAEGVPEAKKIPPMLRRRCTPLSRAMLTAAFDVLGDAGLAAQVRTVFASRYGSINESVELLRNIARDERMSPSRFTHTVHNAQSGLFSIAAGNRHATSALAARAESFACGFLESAAHLRREPSRPVLLVMGDVPLVEDFHSLIDDPQAIYAVALLLAPAGADGEGTRVRFDVHGGAEPSEPGVAVAAREADRRGWADAVEFLRWMICAEERLSLPGNGREWTWERA